MANNNTREPAFVSHFRTKGLALIALNILIKARRDGFTNKEILNFAGFLDLFDPKYLEGKSITQLEWILKNIGRDLKYLNREELSVEWRDSKDYFESLRRVNNSKYDI